MGCLVRTLNPAKLGRQTHPVGPMTATLTATQFSSAGQGRGPLRGRTQSSRHHVGIEVGSHGELRVPEDLHHHSCWHVLCKQEGRAGVPEVSCCAGSPSPPRSGWQPYCWSPVLPAPIWRPAAHNRRPGGNPTTAHARRQGQRTRSAPWSADDMGRRRCRMTRVTIVI